MRALLLLSSLTLLALALPAHAAADCGASLEGPSALAGGSCSADVPVVGTVASCVEVLTTDGYAWGFDVAGFDTEPGCEAGPAGAAGCQAWLDQQPGPYPNEGVDCRAPALTPVVSPRACVELLDGRWAFGFDVLNFQTTTGCGRGPAPQDLT
jgi:hypothetical protein